MRTISTAVSFFACVIIPLLIGGCGPKVQVTFLASPVVVPNPNTSSPLTCFIDFDIREKYDSIYLTIKSPDRTHTIKYSSSQKAEAGYLVMLMLPDQAYTIGMEIRAQGEILHRCSDPLTFMTPPLPDDDRLFPKVEITKGDSSSLISMEDLILFNPRRRIPITSARANQFNKSFGLLAIVDRSGDVLWYYQTDSRISDFELLPNGHIKYMTQDSRLVEIDFAGNVLRSWYAAHRPEGPHPSAIPVDALTFHHDAALLSNGNHLVLSSEVREITDYYTSERDKNAPRTSQKVMGDVVIEFTPDGEIVHRWHAFDHLPVMRIGYETFSNYWIRRGFPGVIDWSHANAVVPVEGEDAYLINFRYQSAVMKIQKSSGEIEWIFAEPSGWDPEQQEKLLTISEGGLNWHQHSPSFTRHGHLLFFNNNNYQARPFNETIEIPESPSYVAEYAIDRSSGSVSKMWSTEHLDGDILVSIAMGSVRELTESGNILACYGALLPNEYFGEMTWWNRGKFQQWTMVREFTHTDPVQVIWEMQLRPLTPDSKIGWTLFGARQVALADLL